MWVDTGATGPETPNPSVDYLYVYQGSSVSLTTSTAVGQRRRSPRTTSDRCRRASEPGDAGILTGDLATGFAYTPGTNPALVNTDDQLHYLVTDTDGHVAQQTITVRILAAGDPTDHPSRFPTRHRPTGRR